MNKLRISSEINHFSKVLKRNQGAKNTITAMKNSLGDQNQTRSNE